MKIQLFLVNLNGMWCWRCFGTITYEIKLSLIADKFMGARSYTKVAIWLLCVVDIPVAQQILPNTAAEAKIECIHPTLPLEKPKEYLSSFVVS